MAKTTITQITDDLDGSASASTYTFGWQGTEYSIDLSNKNAKAFEKALRPYMDAGEKVSTRSSRSTRRARSARSTQTRKSTTPRRDQSAIRTWAKENGHEVSERGRISQAVVDEYNATH